MVEIKEAWPVFLGRLQRNAGPVAPSMGAFANHLLEAGYSPHTIKRSLLLAARFGHWLHSRGLCLQTLDQGCIERFLAHRRNQGWVEGNGASGNLRKLLAFLQHEGHSSAPPPTAPTAIDQIQGAFSKHLVQERGVGLAWSEECLFFVHRFLHARFGEGPIQLDEIQVTDIHGFLVREAHRYHPGRTRGAVAAMRGFFKWLYACGEMSRDLSNAVPKVPVWRHATLPKSMKSQEVELLLRSCRRDTAMGRRDYAILLLLARLGLRAHEVAALTLDDIEWDTPAILVRGKGGRQDRLPLPRDVGAAVAAYLRSDRPHCSTRAVFIRSKAPIRGFTDSSGICRVVRRALVQADLHPPRRGAHLLRHSLACTLLERGANLPEIGEILRHRNLATTGIYAKVDLGSLMPLAQPWPQAGGAR